MSVAPSVSMAALDALIAKANEARAAIASLGSGGGISNALRRGPAQLPVPAGRAAPHYLRPSLVRHRAKHKGNGRVPSARTCIS